MRVERWTTATRRWPNSCPRVLAWASRISTRSRSGATSEARWPARGNLGTAAGTARAGASRIELAPGEQPTPPHVHGRAEEIFFVLAGSGLTLLDDDAYEIRAGDCIVYRNLHEEHTIRAGDDRLDVIAFGEREDLPAGELPRGRSMWSSTGYIEVQEGHPWDREPELVWPEPTKERPSVIVATADIEPDVRDGRRRRRTVAIVPAAPMTLPSAKERSLERRLCPSMRAS